MKSLLLLLLTSLVMVGCGSSDSTAAPVAAPRTTPTETAPPVASQIDANKPYNVRGDK